MKFCGCLTIGNDEQDERPKKYLKCGMYILLCPLVYYKNLFEIDLSINNVGSSKSKK